MRCSSLDLTIEEALADPVIGAAMRADKVDPRHVETLLRGVARQRGIAAGPDGRAGRPQGWRVAAREGMSW